MLLSRLTASTSPASPKSVKPIHTGHSLQAIASVSLILPILHAHPRITELILPLRDCVPSTGDPDSSAAMSRFTKSILRCR
jgi:hypothetical protein